MEPHTRDRLATLLMRPRFYRRLYRGILRVVVIQSLVLTGLCLITVYLGFVSNEREYLFTTSPSGRIVALKPLGAPPAATQPPSSSAAMKPKGS